MIGASSELFTILVLVFEKFLMVAICTGLILYVVYKIISLYLRFEVIPDTPSKTIKNMLRVFCDEGIPEWVETLERYENQGIQSQELKKSISKLERVFQKEIKQYNENCIELQSFNVKKEGSRTITEQLEKQKELILEMGEEILSIRVQDEAISHALKTEKLEKKMDKELSSRIEVERVREEVRVSVLSIEEQKLRDILSSAEASTDMKKRAEQLLPHFKGETREEQQQVMKKQDFELDLQTLERIVVSKIALDENEET